MADTRRLFFALWPPADLRADIRKLSRKAIRASGGRPVPVDNYHLTLAFLGNVPADLCPAVISAAARIAPPSGELCLSRFGYWAAARVLWLGSDEPVPGLARAVSELWAAMEALGLERDRRPFHAHLTLARKAGRGPVEAGPARSLRWPYRGFVLAESDTRPDGARYRVIEAFPAGSCPEPYLQ